MAIRIVQSKQNAGVKQLRAALIHPGRGDADLVALEGIHLLLEALHSGLDLPKVFVARGHEHLLAQLGIDESTPDALTEVLVLPPSVLASAVTTESPQPIAALARPRHANWLEILARHPLIVVLAGIQDPGNLGAILRSAEAFGASGAICLPGTVSRWNPKALRASAGSAFRLPVLTISEKDCFKRLRQAGATILAAMAHDAQPLVEHDLTGPVALVIGSEGAGISPELAVQCDTRITIQCPGPVESLNAAVAASVLLYEASRQRTLAKSRRQT
jgi:RNA methyltransferase, TrmH family